jgi:hypothetical protein
VFSADGGLLLVFGQKAAQAGDPLPDFAAVYFYLLFAAAASQPNPAPFSGEVCPAMGEARQFILELGEFYLGFGLGGAGIPGKNLEDEPFPV